MGKCGTLAKLRAFHAEHVRDAELRQAAAGGSQPAPVSSHDRTIIRSGATGLIHAECSCGWKSSEYETERTGMVKAIHNLHVVLAEVSRG